MEKGKSLEVWALDEHRIGLMPVKKRMWAKKGKTPVVRVKRGYEWMWVYGFCQPQTGQSFWMLLPRLNARVARLALQAFAKQVNPTQRKEIVLLLDQASAHTGSECVYPKGIERFDLPPKSPELQPCERMWRFVDEVLANQVWNSLDEIEPVLVERCCVLMEDTETIKKETLFSWWPLVTSN